MTSSACIRFCSVVHLLVIAVAALILPDRSDAQVREFHVLLVGLEEVPNSDVADLLKSAVSELSIPITVETISRGEWITNTTDGKLEAAERRHLKDKNADLAVVFSNYVDRNRAASISFRLVGFPIDGNYPAFPDEIYETLVFAGTSSMSPILALYTSEAIANSFRPDELDGRRFQALREYASTLEALDQCAPIGGASLQVVLLGGISVPSQEECDDSFVLDAAYAYLTMCEEFLDVLSASEIANLFIETAEVLYLQGTRELDSQYINKSLAFAESAVELRGEVEDMLALLSGLFLRYQQENAPGELNRIAAMIGSHLSKQKESEALYHAALSTVQRERFRHSGNVDDLESSVRSSQRASDLDSLDMGIEAHLLLRTQLAQALFQLGRTTNDDTLRENARHIAKKAMRISSAAGYDDLAAFIASSVR